MIVAIMIVLLVMLIGLVRYFIQSSSTFPILPLVDYTAKTAENMYRSFFVT